MASKRARKKKHPKKRSNPRRRRHVARAAPPRRRRRAHAHHAVRHHRRRRRNPGMGPVVNVVVGAVGGAGAGALLDYGIEHFAGSIPDMAKTGIKIAGAIGAALLFGGKHPAAAAGAAAGFLAPEAAKVLHKIIPPPSGDQAARMQALYEAQMGALMQGGQPIGDMGGVGYDYGYSGR